MIEKLEEWLLSQKEKADTRKNGEGQYINKVTYVLFSAFIAGHRVRW